MRGSGTSSIPPLWRALAVVAITSLVVGYNLSVLNTATPILTAEFNWCGPQSFAHLVEADLSHIAIESNEIWNREGRFIKNVGVPLTYEYFSCDKGDQYVGFISAALIWGATVGALACSGLLQLLGRRRTLILTLAGFAFGGIGAAAAWTPTQFALARVATGFFLGVATVAAGVYVTEISPPEHRSRNGLIPAIVGNLGIMLGILAGYPFRIPTPMEPLSTDEWLFMRGWWSFMMYLPVIPSILSIIILYFWIDFETPSYLVSIGQHEAAMKLERLLWSRSDGKTANGEDLQWLYDNGGGHVKDMSITKTRKGYLPANTDPPTGSTPEVTPAISPRIRSESQLPLAIENIPGLPGPSNSAIPFSDAFANKKWRNRLLLGSVVSILQQFCGMGVLIASSNNLFAKAGVPSHKLSYASAAMAFVQFVCSIFGTFFSKYSRRMVLGKGALLLTCVLSPAIVLGMLSNVDPKAKEVTAIACTLGFAAIFGLTIGPGLLLYLNDIFPPEIRDVGMGLAFALNWFSSMCSIIVAAFLTQHHAYILFASVCFSLFLVIQLCTPPPLVERSLCETVAEKQQQQGHKRVGFTDAGSLDGQ